ncbi:MAG: glycosyltransferase family 4 protein [Bryobacterales bacterium]|nr:glycosyltransferase family 4 protein [Bryobacterales bacterium]
MQPVPERRLGYLVSQYPTVHHTFILREIRRLRELGWDLTVISIRPSTGGLPAEEAEEQARTQVILSAPPWRIAAAHAMMAARYPAGYVRALWCALRMGRPNLAEAPRRLAYFAEAVVAAAWFVRAGVTHLHSHFSSTIALLASRAAPLTFSATIHGSDEFIDPEGFALREKARAARFVVAISNYGRSQVLRFAGGGQSPRVEVCRLGVDPDTFVPVPKSGSGPVFRLLSVARLTVGKGFSILFEALAQLRARGLTAALTLVGDGPARADLAALASCQGLQDEVTFVGWQDQGAVLDFYRQADAFVLPSFAEGVPVVLMEAMALELPCVTTFVDGIPELVRDDFNGLLVPPADAGALATAIERLMDSEDLRTRLGREARRTVEQQYNLRRNVEQLADIFERYTGTMEETVP